MSPTFVYGMLALTLCYVLACRIDKMMRGVTKPVVFFQHAMLAACAMASWLMEFTSLQPWGEPVFAFGVLQFFFFSLSRWKTRAPDGTMK